MENNKINIAELLRKCPHGMELDSTMYDTKVFYQGLNKRIPTHPITVQTEHGFEFELTQYGQIHNIVGSKCVIFPKGKTTWEGFVPPRKFKDGDILYIDCTGDECSYKHNKYIFILKEISDGKIYCYCYIDEVNKYKNFNISWLSDMTYTPRFATEEEKQRLFDSIKENGYRWNPETKTLEMLVAPKFKVGDRIRCKNGVDKYDGFEEGIIDTITDNKYGIVIPHLMGIVGLINITDQDNWELVTLKFKTGDRIRHRIKRREEGRITNVSFNFYDVFTTDEKTISIPIREQDEWKLVPDKIKPKFKVGDRVKHKQSFISGVITNIDDDCYKIKYDSGAVSFAIIKDQDDWELVSDKIEPKFKVGDKIKKKGQDDVFAIEIAKVREGMYSIKNGMPRYIESVDKEDYELVPNKFDITTLKPFESKVLVRNDIHAFWKPAIFGVIKNKYFYTLGGAIHRQCIPYEENKHLLGIIEDCDEFYKTWEE